MLLGIVPREGGTQGLYPLRLLDTRTDNFSPLRAGTAAPLQRLRAPQERDFIAGMPWDFAAILLALAFIVPWRTRAKMRKLLELPRITSPERLSLYASTIAFQWVFLAVVVWRAWARGLGPVDLATRIADPWQTGITSVVGALLLALFQWLNFRRIRSTSSKTRATLLRLARVILPQTDVERLAYVALALTAGVCEEFLYRGFALSALLRAGAPVWAAVGTTAGLFGIAHLYQGRGGVLTTFAFGVVLGAARISLQSLVPAIVWHATVDLMSGLIGSRYLREWIKEQPSS